MSCRDLLVELQRGRILQAFLFELPEQPGGFAAGGVLRIVPPLSLQLGRVGFPILLRPLGGVDLP